MKCIEKSMERVCGTSTDLQAYLIKAIITVFFYFILFYFLRTWLDPNHEGQGSW